MFKPVIWSMNDLYEICVDRQKNELNCNIAWSGNPGVGKSTGAFKLGSRFEVFDPWKYIVFTRKESLPILEGEQFKFIIDDEAIRSSFKRNFQDTDQKLLIQMFNMYRDNFNIYNLCIPSFYSLDRELRTLIKIHIHVIERGKAVIHKARDDRLYSDDPWDVSYNQKLENSWGEKKKKNPGFKIPYHKLTTFIGYLEYGPLGIEQERIYKQIKKEKRKAVYDTEMQTGIKNEDKGYKKFYEYALNRLHAGNPISETELVGICQMSNKSFQSYRTSINDILKESGNGLKFSQIFPKGVHPNSKSITLSSEKNNQKVYLPPLPTN